MRNTKQTETVQRVTNNKNLTRFHAIVADMGRTDMSRADNQKMVKELFAGCGLNVVVGS